SCSQPDKPGGGRTITTSTGVLRIGGNGIWPEWFAGLIDEVRIYNRALTAGEIQRDLQTAVGGLTGTAPPPDTTAPCRRRWEVRRHQHHPRTQPLPLHRRASARRAAPDPFRSAGRRRRTTS